MRARANVKLQRPKPSKAVARARTPSMEKSDEPLYLQVARELKKEIVGGVYPVGSHLPTESELCERFEVSHYTVREALRRLRDDRLVTSRQGAGTIVVPRPHADAYAQDVVSINGLLEFATGARFTMQSIDMITIDTKLAARTGLTAGEEWLAVRGLRQREGAQVPVCWTEYYINREFAAVGKVLARHVGPIFPLIEDLFGRTILEVQQEIGAAILSAQLAQSLKVEVGTAALEVRRTYKCSDADVAQVTINTHPASRFRHSMTMRRVRM